jgi:hypothetical protein
MNTLAMKGKIQHLKNHITELRQLSNSLNHDANIMSKENERESEDEE